MANVRDPDEELKERFRLSCALDAIGSVGGAALRHRGPETGPCWRAQEIAPGNQIGYSETYRLAACQPSVAKENLFASEGFSLVNPSSTKNCRVVDTDRFDGSFRDEQRAFLRKKGLLKPKPMMKKTPTSNSNVQIPETTYGSQHLQQSQNKGYLKEKKEQQRQDKEREKQLKKQKNSEEPVSHREQHIEATKDVPIDQLSHPRE